MLGKVEPPAAVITAFFILGETVHGVQWFGMLVVLAGISISEIRGKRSRMDEEREEYG
ncbi:hypothetical protein [Paenibacillus thalictri]|uniref:hypothetical protein n=1 Tax=Paenibacillus thalictri TaxID=2527873 RepID=UPI0013EF492D|nr:hypothetical protein [Paenibacillus thalictri]